PGVAGLSRVRGPRRQPLQHAARLGRADVFERLDRPQRAERLRRQWGGFQLLQQVLRAALRLCRQAGLERLPQRRFGPLAQLSQFPARRLALLIGVGVEVSDQAPQALLVGGLDWAHLALEEADALPWSLDQGSQRRPGASAVPALEVLPPPRQVGL